MFLNLLQSKIVGSCGRLNDDDHHEARARGLPYRYLVRFMPRTKAIRSYRGPKRLYVSSRTDPVV